MIQLKRRSFIIQVKFRHFLRGTYVWYESLKTVQHILFLGWMFDFTTPNWDSQPQVKMHPIFPRPQIKILKSFLIWWAGENQNFRSFQKEKCDFFRKELPAKRKLWYKWKKWSFDKSWELFFFDRARYGSGKVVIYKIKCVKESSLVVIQGKIPFSVDG